MNVEYVKTAKSKRTLSSVCGKCDTEIMHWIHYAAADEIPTLPPALDDPVPNFSINRRIFLHDGSIAEIDCDVVVLSCNKNLKAKGMKMVFDEAGQEFISDAAGRGPRQTTDVVPMDGYDLPASNIYLVVVPPASQTADEHTQIEQCYLNILNQAVVQGATSIAFPALGSRAASDILKESVAKIACKTIRTWMTAVVDGKPNYKRVTSIIFCRWTDTDVKAFDKGLHKWFPLDETQLNMIMKNEENLNTKKKKGKGKKKK